MNVNFQRLTWEDYPSTETPVNADNLNRLEEGVAGLYSDMAGIEEGIDSFKDETSAQVSAMQTRLTTMEGDIDSFEEITLGQVGSMQSKVTSMENGLPTMVGEQIDTKFGDDIGDNVTAWLTEHVDPVGSAVAVDDTLTIAGAAADAKKTGDEISSLKEDSSLLDDRVTALEGGGSGSGLTEDIKVAMLQIAQKVAYVDERGQDYYDDLYDALYPSAYLVSISAVYTQSGTVYDTDTLDSLKADLVVTATYSDSTTQTVTNYTLSGTLAEGTSTVTVRYDGKTTTFNVAVTRLLPEGYTKLAYVATNSTQYVDTGLNETQTTHAEYEVAVTAQPKVNGNHILSSLNTYFPFLKGSSASDADWKTRCGGKLKGNETFDESGIAVFEFHWALNQRYVISGYPEVVIDGTVLDSLSVGSTASASNKLTLFAYGGKVTDTGYRFNGKMYWCKIYDANEDLLRDFIPAKNASNVAGLYDRVSQTFFTSATSTALIAGEEA